MPHISSKVNKIERARHDSDIAAEAMTSEMAQHADLSARPHKWWALAVRYLIPLLLTVGLVWYLFSMVDFAGMLHILENGVDYWWILLAMGLSIFSHIFRAMRWNLQLRILGIHAPLMALTCSIFGCYALNLIFPRLGEVWRCTYIAKRQKAPFTTVLGSMVSDRLTDTLSVTLITIFTFIVANSAIVAFLTKYPVGRDVLTLLTNPIVWGATIGGCAIIGAALYITRHSAIVTRLLQWFRELWLGFKSIWLIKGKWKFVILTFAIWGCFFIQLYVAFYAFNFTEALCHKPGLAFGLTPCLVAFVLSSIGMAIPSNGGLGPWNIGIMFGLAIYGISDEQGTAFSIAQWSGQTIMLTLLGIFTMIYIALSSKQDLQNATKPDPII